MTPIAHPPHGRIVGVALALALTAAPAAAPGQRADPQRPDPIEVAYSVHGDDLHISFDVTGLLDTRWLERMDSGLTASVVIAAAVLALGEDGGEPIATALRRCEIIYDLWGERYTVTVVDDGRRRQWIAYERDTALTRCTRPTSQRLVRVDNLDLRRRYVVEVIVDLDPDRPEMRARTREYLGDPAGDRKDGAGGPSFFGSVVRALFRDGGEEGSRAVRRRGVPFGEPLLTQALAAAEARQTLEAGHEPEGEEE